MLPVIVHDGVELMSNSDDSAFGISAESKAISQIYLRHRAQNVAIPQAPPMHRSSG